MNPSLTEPFKMNEWLQAWGCNASLVVDTEGWGLPELPPKHEWIVTRELTAGNPTYRIALCYIGAEPGYHSVIDHAKIDKIMYGEVGVRQRAQRMHDRAFGGADASN